MNFCNNKLLNPAKRKIVRGVGWPIGGKVFNPHWGDVVGGGIFSRTAKIIFYPKRPASQEKAANSVQKKKKKSV